ncbi:hypothetical protein [Nonomuraea dietziae]|uniref:hypothetical protein n=1 Tax=Nonomuraea dietziae TaxID=65515 RepID=UPI0033D3EC36
MSHRAVHEEILRGGARQWALKVLADLGGLRAVRHPLGFVCLPLERDGGEGVCLHLWSAAFPAADTTTSQIHCHSWDLVSHVLYGQVRNVHAVVEEADGDATHRVFEVISDAGGDRIEPTSRTVRHRTGLVETFGRGETYTLSAGRFHSSVVPEHGEAATIALGRVRAGSHDLSLGPLDTPAHHITRGHLDAAQTARAARLIAEHLT